jgi:hypothetical protein
MMDRFKEPLLLLMALKDFTGILTVTLPMAFCVVASTNFNFTMLCAVAEKLKE